LPEIGGNAAGNPDPVSPVYHHTERNEPRCALVVAYEQPVDWSFSATLRRPTGQETTSLILSVEQQPVPLSQEAGVPENQATGVFSRLIHS